MRRAQRLAAGKCQQPLRHIRARPRDLKRFGDQFGAFRLILGEVRQHFQVHHQDRQNIVEIMGDPAGKLADGFHLGCLQQLVFDAAAMGNIANGADKITGVAVRHIADRQFHRKRFAVLAQPDHFAADADDFCIAGAEIVFQITVMGRPVWLRHQNRHVPADGFIGTVEEYPFCRRIEVQDLSVLVDNDQRVDAIVHERPETAADFVELLPGDRRFT